MTTMKIDFDFDELDYQSGKDLDSVCCPIRITVDDVIITKCSLSVSDDDGFRGDNLANVLVGWLDAVPKLLAGESHESWFLEEPETIDFTPKNGMIYVRCWEPEEPGWEHAENETDRQRYENNYRCNRGYPNYPHGTPVPPAVLVNEFIRVSEDFLAFIEPYDKKKNHYVASLREELKKAKKFWKDNVRK